jgi:hypothetical protein
MKNIFTIIWFSVACLLISSCGVTKNPTNHKQYNAAVIQTVNKLQKNPTKQKHILFLEAVYKDAQRFDLETIEQQKRSGNPDAWASIFQLYSDMNNRQNKVKLLPPLYIKKQYRYASFQFLDYDQEIALARQNAAAYFYAKGIKELQAGDKMSARNAFNSFLRVKTYYGEYRDLDSLQTVASNAGVTHVLVSVENSSGVNLPPKLNEDLKRLSVQHINERWVKYYSGDPGNYTYDYQIKIRMDMVDVTPEMIRNVHYTDKAKIEDGWNYVLDSKGNVMKDTLGNDIKTPAYKNITCNVIETIQTKSARVAGLIIFSNLNNGQFLREEPIVADAFFEHCSALAIGDLRALSPESRSKLGSPISFPTDHQMLMQAGNTFKSLIPGIISKNQRLIN